MFGHVRGSFTGADRDRVGKLGAVGSGTLLDIHGEIGRVSMSVILVPFPKPAAAAG